MAPPSMRSVCEANNIKYNSNDNLIYSYYRIKTSHNNNSDNDYTIHLDLCKKIYK